jgi:hypothetical protein
MTPGENIPPRRLFAPAVAAIIAHETAGILQTLVRFTQGLNERREVYGVSEG